MAVAGKLIRATALRSVMVLSGLGVTTLTGHEALKQTGYVDSVGVATACIGHTKTAVVGKWYTREECEVLFKQDVAEFEYTVNRYVTVGLSQPQFDSLVSFCFNVGSYNCRTSTMFKRLNGGDYRGAIAEFDRWVFAKGRDCRIRKNNCYGVVVRRMAEKKMFMDGTFDGINAPTYPVVASGITTGKT